MAESINTDALEQARSLIRSDGHGPYRAGVLVDFQGDLSIHVGLACTEHRENQVTVHSAAKSFLKFVTMHLWDTETLIERLYCQHSMWTQGTLDDGAWLRYASADIDLFHIVIRSLFDHLACVFKQIANSPGCSPDFIQ
jgi:hypothetical protein